MNRSFDLSYQTKSKAFTLLELLVVIAILASIVLLVLPNYVAVRQKGRDTQRKTDLRQIQKALELYRQDQDPPSYPAVTNAYFFGTCGQAFSGSRNTYLPKTPCNPGSAVPTPYYYEVDNSQLTYTLCTCLENKGDMERQTGSCNNPNYLCESGYYFKVTAE